VPSGELTCRLRCIRIHRGGSGGRSDIKTLWETTWTIRAGTQWQLNVVVPTRDFDDEPVFDLPVRA